jgi:hypothetical protein
MTLPTPLEMTVLGTGLIVAAGLVFFFLKILQMALWLGAAGCLLLLCASIAFGYEDMGEKKIQPLLDAANSKISRIDAASTEFKRVAGVSAVQATQATQAKNAALAQLRTAQKGRLDAQPPDVAGLVIPAAASVYLNSNISAANLAALGLGAGDEAAAAAAAATTTKLRDWEEWGTAVSNQYGRVAGQLIELQNHYNRLFASQPAPVQ